MNTDYGVPPVDLSAFGKRASVVPPPPLPPAPDPTPPPIAPDAPDPTDPTPPPIASDPTDPTGPPIAPDPTDPTPPPKAPQRRTASKKSVGVEPSAAEPKLQFFVHLPADEHAWLRQQALDKGWPKREVILEAFVNHRDRLSAHDPDTERRRQAGLPPRTPGRRKEVGGIPSNVYMARSEAEVLDRHAGELGMSRSQMVTELLRLASSPATATTDASR